MNQVKLELDEVLLTAVRLGEMGDVYTGVITQLKAIKEGNVQIFENGSAPVAAFRDVVSTLWDYSAQSHDNLKTAGVVVTHYVNAVCAEDTNAANELKTEARGLNDQIDGMERNNGLQPGELGARLPEITPCDPDGTTVDVPKNDKAERPPGPVR